MNLRELVAKISFQTDTHALDRVEHHLEGIQGKLEILAAGEILRGIFELAEKFSTFGEDLETAAISAGMTVEAFQKLAFAAGQNAVSQEELSGSLAKLARNLSEARDGSKGALEAFANVGIGPEQVAGFRNAGDAMAALSDKIAQIDDPIKRTAAIMALLGRGSANMAKFLSHGSKEMQELSGQAEAMGTVLSTDQVENLAKLEDSMSALGLVFKTLGASIAANFAPSIIWLTQAISKFYAANRKAISVNMEKWAYDITYALGYAYGWFEKITQIVFDFADAHPTLVRRVGEFALALGGVSLAISTAMFVLGPFRHGLELLKGIMELTGKAGGLSFGAIATAIRFAATLTGNLIARLGLLIVETFPALGEALFAIGTALSANPLTLYAGAVLGIVLAVQALWKVFHGGDFWKDTWLGQALSALKNMSAGLLSKFGITTADIDKGVQEDTEKGIGGGLLPNDFNKVHDGVMQLQEPVRVGLGGMARMNAPPLDMSKLSPAHQEMVNSGGNQTNTFNANVTVNAPAGVDAKQVATLTKSAMQEQFELMMRDTQRNLQSPVRG